jgi:sterol desaturase/sphingolipid hydroxylase (fatty acid hydroxylase superfamily)
MLLGLGIVAGVYALVWGPIPLPSAQALIIYFGLGLVATIFELVRPARKLNYWAGDAIILDIVAWFFYFEIVSYWASFLVGKVPIHFQATHFVMSIPLPLRVIAYFVAGDFSSYWMHRLTHTKYVWRVHHFHHSITQLYWLSGVRDTIWQQMLSNLPYILWSPLLTNRPEVVAIVLTFISVLTNHWMHMNFTWRSNWLEYVLVTPRSHQVHHSGSAEHFNANYGVVFSVWDRLFGTWISPDDTKVTTIGAGEIRNPLQAGWLMLGVFGTEEDSMVRSWLQRCLVWFRGPAPVPAAPATRTRSRKKRRR